MNVEFAETFLKDLKSVKDGSVFPKIKKIIETVERAESLLSVLQVRKLRGSREHYRIRLGDYRLALKVDRDTIVFVRFLHRKDIYRYFP